MTVLVSVVLTTGVSAAATDPLTDATALTEGFAAVDGAVSSGDLAGVPPGSRARRPSTRPALPVGEIVVSVRLNDQPFGEAIVLQDPERGLLVERGDLAAWRVATPDAVQLREGVEYIALGEIPGLRHAFDPRTSLLTLTVDPQQFVREDRALYDLAVPTVTPPGFGAFLNYDAEARRSDVANTTNGAVLFGVFGKAGVLTTDWAFSDLEDARLNTTFTHDSLSRIATLRIGDFTGSNSTLGAGAPLGGIQWATNFATRPGLVPIPLQRLQGQVSVPSTVEVFVNGVPAYRTEVQPGPFFITDIPVVTGSGSVEMVITDPLGRRQVVSNPFYASPTVLRAGLSEYSYELGALRVPSVTGTTLEYDTLAARMVHRTGLTDTFTGEIQAEATETSALLGSGLAWLVPGGGVLRFALAASTAETDLSGAQALLGYERVFQRWSVSFEGRHATAGYGQIGGLLPDPLHSRDQGSAVVGYHSSALGSMALSMQRQRNMGIVGSTRSATLSWNRNVGTVNLSVSGTYDDISGDASAFVSASLPFGRDTTASLTHSQDLPAIGTGATESQANLQRNLGTGPGWGYRLGAAQGGDALAELDLQGEVGTYRMGVERLAGVDTNFLTAGGSVAFVGGGFHASRRLGDGFVLVRLPGAEGVGVYADNNYIGRTDGDGEQLVPAVVPYRPTHITLDATSLPLELQLKSDRLTVTPAYRAAAVLEFPSELSRAYTATLVRRDGKPVPAGARIWHDDSEESDPIGSDGFIFLTVDPGTHTLTARWADQTCTARITIEANDDPIPDLGRIVCEEAP